LQKVGADRRAARYPSGFARLAPGAFYETIVLVTFYEIIKSGVFKKELFTSARKKRRGDFRAFAWQYESV